MLGVGVNMIWVGTAGSLMFMAVDRLIGNRVRLEDEILGLDVAELGMEGYFDARTPAPNRGSEPNLPRLPSGARLPAIPMPVWSTSTQDPFRR
jgi:hypothetical protein